MVVSFRSGATLRVGNPRLLFEGEYVFGYIWGRDYDLAPDGKRFLMLKTSEPPPPATQLHLVLNWFEELKTKVGN